MHTKVAPEQFVVDAHGKPRAVILSFVNYQRLLRLAEDRDDARVLQRAIRTHRGLVPHASLVKHLKRRGLL